MQLGLRTAAVHARARVTLSRVLTVTLGLGAAGAVIGGTIALGFFAAFVVGLRWAGFPHPVPFPSLTVAVGATLGALGLPIAAWARPHASLGRIIAITGIGAIIGVPLGLRFSVNLVGAVLGAIVGFACAVTWLAMFQRSASAASLHRLGIS